MWKTVISRALLLLLVIAIGGLSIDRAYSQAEDRDTQLGVKNTLHIYPGSVTNSTWTDVEQVLSPDLDEEALYQEFTRHNSAHVPLPSDEAAQKDAQSEMTPPNGASSSGESTATTTATTSAETATPTVEPVSEPAATNSPVQIEEPAALELEAQPEAELEPTVEQTPEPAQEPEPEPETEETPAPADETSQPVVLKKATETLFAFLGTVTEFFPFMNDAEVEEVAAVVQAEAQPEAELEPTVEQTQEPEPAQEPEPEPESEAASEIPASDPMLQEPESVEPSMEEVPLQTEEALTSPEEPIEKTPNTLQATSTEETISQDQATTTGDVLEESEAPAEPPSQYVFTLSDFSAPELKRGEFITGMQLRMSLAAQYEPKASSSAPVLEINYKTPSSTQQVGTIVIDGEVSNALNGGYFLFALPQIASIAELNDVEVEVVYKGDTEQLGGVYIDTAWLQIEVEHLDKELLHARLVRDLLRRLSDPSMHTLMSEDIDFTREELPHFSLKYTSQRNLAVRFFRDLFGRKLAEVEAVSFVHKDIGDVGITPEVSITDEGIINIQLEEEDRERLRPGEYLVEITINEGGATYTDTFSFQWGLLSINSNQTAYELGDTVEISMGALSQNGNTICDAALSLYIIDPQEVLSKVPVQASGLCNGNNVVDVPDYAAVFTPEVAGEHEMYLERIDADGTIAAHTIDTFMVEENLPFVLERKGPSRVYPLEQYPMEITLTAQEAWEGTLIEQVPSSFVITKTDAAISTKHDVQELSWDVSLEAGVSQSFAYTFDAPDISPYLYTVGSARLEGELPESMRTADETASSTATTTPASSPMPAGESTTTPSELPDLFEAGATTSAPLPVVETPQDTEQGTEEVPAAGMPQDTQGEEVPETSDALTEPEAEQSATTAPEIGSGAIPAPVLSEPQPMESVAATNMNSVVFEEHRQWQIASDATGNLIVFWNSGAAIPAGWTCLSCGSGTFYQRFPMGGDTYNTTGGATTHTHTATGVVNSSNTTNTENNGSGEISIPTHSHLYTPNISTVSNLPAYRQFRVIQSNSAGDPATIPAGAIMMFDDASLPTGWTRLSALDGRYPRGENSIANGGSNTHTHNITGNTTAASNVSTLNSRFGGSQVTGAADNHAHSVSSNTASINSEPPFIEVIFATAGIATSTPQGAIAMWSDEPPAQWIDRSSSPSDPFNGRFVKGATSYGTTGGSATHTHADIFGIVSSDATITDNARSGSSGNSGAHTHLVDVTNFSTANNLPPYLTVIYGKKLGAVPVYTQTGYLFYANENANTPSDPYPAGAADLLENEPITSEDEPLASGDALRIRMQLQVTNSTSTADSFKLQYGTTTALCTDISVWSDVGSATSSAAWRGYENAGVNDGDTLASATLASTTVLATYEENNPTASVPNPIGVDDYGEWDFVVQQNNAEAGTIYCFRMVQQDGTPLFAYSEYPQVMTNQAPNAPDLFKLFDNEKIGTTTPNFEFSAADEETDDLEYQIQIDNDYDFSSAVVDHNTVSNATLFQNLATPADKDPFTNGELIRYNSATALNNGTTYYWRVRARDPNGSNTWGSWATIQSFTVDTSVTVSTWFQTTQEQFETNTLLNVEAAVSDQMQILSPFATGTVYSDPITFEEGELGTAWGDFVFADTETSSDVKYSIQYNDNDTWTDIPDADLPGNSTGFDTSPVSLLGVDKTVYAEIRIAADLTDSGASPSIQSWSVDWDYLIETPTISEPFANEKVSTTTPTFEFTTTDPQDNDLIYQLQWSTSYDFSAPTTRTSDTNTGFTNVDSGADTSPFSSGDSIRFEVQAGDALSNGTTYWWRVRARDPLGSNTYSFYTTPRSFTVDTSVTVSTWFQTTQSQFDNNLLSGLYTQSGDTVTVATTSDESIVVYAEGTVTTPRYRRWSGTAWSTESSALNVGATINWIVTRSSPIENEYITGTLGSDGDVNLQVFKNGAWGNLEEISTSISNVDMRGFDIAYETNSGDAVAVACDGNADPSYHIWNGTSWSDEGDIDRTGTNACGWVRLISDPDSDEIIAIVRDILGSDYEAMVWDGSSWGNFVTWGAMSEDINEGIAASYEESGDQAVVAVSNGGAASFSWRAWNGSSWTGAASVALGDDFEWGSIAADVGSDDMALCYIDNDNDIGVVPWTGSGWTGRTELDTAGNSKTSRAVDCMFEVGGANDGEIMLAYSDTTAVRYRTYDGGWSGEATIAAISDASTVQLQRTGAQLIQLLAYDDVNDRYDYSGWNGTSWTTRQTLESNGSVGAAPFKEPFMIAVQNPGSSGTIIGQPLIDFNEGSGPYWQQMSWTDTTLDGSDILYQIEYYDGDSWELVPDSLLPGNSSGTSTGPIDLSGVLPASTYGQIRPVANLICNIGTCPVFSDWTITWAAGITVSGTALQYDEATNVASGNVAIAVNGVLQTGKTGTISNGTWSIANVNVAQGDVVTVFIDGASDSSEAVAVTAYDGVGNMSGLDLYAGHLVVGSDDAATVSNASLGLYDLTNDEDLFFDVNASNDLSVCASSGCAETELYIKAGNTYQPGTGGNATTFSFENNGTVSANGNTLRVGGSWENNATTNMATSTVIFTATSTQSSVPWYDAQWSHRLPLTIQSSQIDTSVTDFPVYVDLSDLDSTFFSNVNTNGGDIRITTADGQTELPREIVSIDTGAQTGEIYFQADSLSSAGDTTFYIYYGNSSASDYASNATNGSENVWNNDYEAVYHFDESPSASAPQYADSTGNSSGTAVNMEAGDRVAGIAGGAAEVDGVDERIETNFSQSLLNSTWSIFLDADGTQGACDGVMFSRGTGVNGMNAGACTDTSRIGYHWENLAATAWDFAGGAVYPTNEWYMASLVVEPTQATLYAHAQGGVTSGSNVQTHTLSTINNLDFGWDSFGVARSFDGTMDEVRLSSVSRTADWLDAEYRNISSPGTFYAVSASESFASSTSGLPYTLTDADGTLDFYTVTFGEGSGTSEWEIADSLDVDNALTVAYGTLARGSETITVAGNVTTQANGLWTGVGTTTFDGTGIATWSDNSTPKQNIGYAVVNGVSKVVQLGSNVEASSVTIGSDDTFDLSTSNRDIVVYGNWVNNNTFNPRNGDVTFSGTQPGQIVTAGGDNFYNLIFNGSGGSWSFTESTLGINNDLSIATGTVTFPTGTTTIAGSFTNSGGSFAHNNGSVLFNSSTAETLTFNGGTFTNALYDVRFQGSGSWSFTEAHATTSNEFRIVQGTVTLPSASLAVGGSFLNTGGTFAHNNGTVRLTGSGTHSIDTNAPFNSLAFTGSGSWSFVDASVTAQGSLTVTAGTVTLPSGTLTLGGSLSNSATLVHNSGTVLFNSNDAGETIVLGSSPLYNVTFNSGTGGWSINGNATTTNDFTLASAGVFTLASGQTLSVSGTFTNSAGGSATTWTGSTLALGGGSFALNTKTAGADGYGTLRVASTTHVSMWNSSSTAYTVDGSLYSQDHSGVDGDLYIWGSYERASGTEHWSYATDFDGTSLAGGSERQADIAFAAGSSATFSGGSLNILGTASATTTIHNQGSGSYALTVSGGTVNADHYQVRNTDASGFAFLGTPSITSLANGDFDLTVPASSISVAASVIDANPALQILNVRFGSAASSSPWLDPWDYRKSHVVQSASGAGTDYPIMMTIHYGSGTDSGDDVYLGSKGSADFSDLRFTSDDGQTLLPYWIESQTDGDQAVVWVNVSADLSSSDATIYVYYGNNSASSQSDGEATFTFFDDFSGASLDTSKWQTFNIDSYSQSNGILTATTTAKDPAKIIASEGGSGETGNNLAFRARFRPRVGANNDQRVGLSIKTSTANGQGYNYLLHNFSSFTPRAFLDDLVAWGPTHSEPWTLGTWYTEEIYHDGTSVLGRFDDGTWNSWARTGRTGYFALNTGGLSETVSNDWDFALIRKIVATEPSHGTWGSEESVNAFIPYNVSASGSPTSYWWFRQTSGDFDGEAFDDDTGDPGSIRWDDSSVALTLSGTVYADNGATPLTGGTCDGVSTPVRIVVEDGSTYDTSCSNVDGSWSMSGVAIVGDPTVTVFLNGASGGETAVTVTKTPTEDIGDLDLYAHRVITRHEDTASMTIADMVHDSTFDSDIIFTVATGTEPLLTVAPDNALFVWASTTFTPGGTVTLQSGGTGTDYDGSLYLANGASFIGNGTTTYTIGGTFTQSAGAVFSAASSSVLMSATTTGKAIDVALGETATFNQLRFSGIGGGWNINGDIAALDDIEVATGTVTGTGDISIPNGSFFGEGLVSLGGGTTTLEQSNTLGGSQGWTLYNLQLGNGTTIGTTTPAGTATTTIGGTLFIAVGHYLDAGASRFDLSGTGTVFVENGTFLEDQSTVRYSGGSATNLLSTTYYDLDLNAGAGAPTYTATGLGILVLHDLTVGGESATAATFDTHDTALGVNGDVVIRSNGTLIGSNSGLFTVAGSWDNDGTYTSSNGTVTFNGSGAINIAAGTSPFGNLTVNGGGNFTISEHATTTGAFMLASSTGAFTLASGQSLALGGSFTNALGGAATTWTGSTLRFVSGTNYEINAKTISDTYENFAVGTNTDIRMWNSSASAYVVDASGSLYSQDHAGVDGDLFIYGNYGGNGGTDHWSYATDFDGAVLGGGTERQAHVRFESGAGMNLLSGGLQVLGSASASTSIENQGSGTYSLLIGGSASTSWSYYAVEDINSAGLTFSGAPHVVTLSHGDFEIAQAGGSGITVGGTVIDINPAQTFTNNNFSTTTGISAFNVTATGTSVSSWRFTNHTGSLDGEEHDVDPDGDPGYIVWDNSAANITIAGNVYSDEGTTVSGVCDGTTNNITVRVAGLTSYAASCNATTGAYSVSGVTYSPGDSIVAYIDGETQKGATVTEDPVSNIGNMHIYENRVIVRHEGTDPLNIADMAVWDSSDDADIPFTAIDGSPDTLVLPANRKLIVWSGKEFEPDGNITLQGGGAGAAYDGTFEAYANAIVSFSGAQEHSIGGSFILGSNASFDAGLSTTTFTTTGAARTIDANSESFYNTVFSGSGSWSITDATFDVQNIFITDGVLTFPTGTTTVSGSFSNNGGSFVINGSTLVFDAATTGNILRAGGSNLEELIFNGVGGAWTMTDANATTTGSVTVQAGTLTLPSGAFAVGGDFRNTGGDIVHNTADLYFTNDTGASLLASSSDLYAVIFSGAGTFTMEDESLSLLDDLRIAQGSVLFASSTLAIGGSFDASGGLFDSATGTVLFNSADAGETIDPGNSNFYNVVLANAGGGWAITGNATATHNFSLSLASSFTQQSGTRLYVGNVFTNNVGGGATTWSGATLILDAGAGYSINTKLSDGDQYGTLIVGDDTDIRVWNSSADTTTVQPSASLYSQDHGGSDGALTIYGDFHVSTTTEYWSYATDFDGASLAGIERAVTVSIAGNATTTVDGGTLYMIGASGNSTTVQNQGSGTYAFAVSDGTFNALYYRYRDLNAEGLLFSGTPFITSLSQGDFELAVSGGSLITLSSATLDANASKVISGNRFATTTAITGTNVTLIGTTTNAWAFVSHTGNLAGEDYDDDGATACGSIRWNDSSCLLTQQTHYRWRHDDGGVDVPDSEWFNASWGARKRVRLENPDAATYTDAAVKLSVAYDAAMQGDFDDLRFTDASGTTTIPHFIERYTASADADIWVQVPSLAAEDITTLYMYFDNATASSTSSSADAFIAADDFEDGNITEYSGDTSLFNVGSSFAYGGSFGLDATAHESDKATDGIADTGLTVSQGQIIRYMQYVDTDAGNGDEVCTLFGVQSPVTSNQNYAICLEQFGVDRMSIVENAQNTDSSGTVLASSTVDFPTLGSGWYEVEIDWQTGGDMDVTLSKDGATAATASASDNTYTSGGIGFTFWFQNGGWDNYSARPHVDTEPTVYFGDKQVSGGASWAADLDESYAYTHGDIARLRVAVENSGLQITGQTFDIEYATKGAAPSCEAVSSASYAIVPPQSSCGSSPLCMQASSHLTDNGATTDLLFEVDGQFTSGKVVEDPSNTTAALTIDQDEYTELEYALTPTINASAPSYCLRVTDASDPLDTYLSVAELELRFDPIVTNVSLNGGAAIALVPGSTTTVYTTGTVTDLNGFDDLTHATATMYRSGVGAACTPDNNNCYVSAAPLCELSGCSGNSCSISCSADFYFHADATDAGSAYEGEEWLAAVEVSDQGGGIDIGSTPTTTQIELLTLHALDVDAAINYGPLAVSSTTGSYNPTTTVQNLGNVPIDIELEGTDLTDGGSSFIPASEQLFATSTFTYTACTSCSALSSTTATDLEVDLTKPTSSSSPVTDVVYWGIEIPYGVASNPHQGTNIFYAIGD